MALSEEERLKKLQKTAKGSLGDLEDLYKEVFGVEFPMLYTRNPNIYTTLLIEAIYTNQKYEGETAPNDVDL